MGYLLESDFSRTPQGTAPLAGIPSELWTEIGNHLEIGDINNLLRTSKTLHTATRVMWLTQMQIFGLKPIDGVSNKMVVRERFLLVYDECLQLFIDAMGVKRILLMPTCAYGDLPYGDPQQLKVTLGDHKMVRTPDFKQFAVRCRNIDNGVEGVLFFSQDYCHKARLGELNWWSLSDHDIYIKVGDRQDFPENLLIEFFKKKVATFPLEQFEHSRLKKVSQVQVQLSLM